MDELMLSSFQSLATHAPRALKQGQEMTLKIGSFVLPFREAGEVG
jgi:hypothetical protein